LHSWVMLPLPSISFPVHYSCLFLPFDTVAYSLSCRQPC
jgi:hypothetical protein